MVLDRFVTFQGTWRIANARKTLITFQGGVLNSGWYKYLTDEREHQSLTRDELGSIRLGILSPNATLSPSPFSTKAENKRMKKKVESGTAQAPLLASMVYVWANRARGPLCHPVFRLFKNKNRNKPIRQQGSLRQTLSPTLHLCIQPSLSVKFGRRFSWRWQIRSCRLVKTDVGLKPPSFSIVPPNYLQIGDQQTQEVAL